MIFFKSRRTQEEEESALARISSQLELLIQNQQAEKEARDLQYREMSEKISRRDMAVENLLDVLEEREDADQERRAREQEHRDSQKQILAVFDVCLEQLWQMCRFLGARDESGGRQAELVWAELNSKMVHCGFTPIAERGVLVDYSFHEVIAVVKAEDDSLNKTVAEIYSPGYLYGGRLIKKAKISAYQTTG